jgi:geranylgeranyl pyrophosphate synthase
MFSNLHVKQVLIRIRLKDNVDQLVNLIGAHFQIRDDYQNLQSAEVGHEPHLSS